MRALILSAGMGSRMGELGRLCAKPALPVRGIPVAALLLRLLAAHGVREVAINLHHRGEDLRRALAEHGPPEVHLRYSPERTLLGTGGAIRALASWLRESDPFLVLAGDMLLDLDLSGLARRHRSRGDLATLALRRDARAARFGSIGIDREGGVRRIGDDFDLGGEADAGVFLGLRCLSAGALETLPERESFEDLRDWLAPLLSRGRRDIRAELLSAEACTWEPVGTPGEYLSANLDPPELSYADLAALAHRAGVEVAPGLVRGPGARLGTGSQLERCVVWAGEEVPAGAQLRDGIFAGGRLHPAAREAARG